MARTFGSTSGDTYSMHFHYDKEVVAANPRKAKSKPHMRPRHTFCMLKKGDQIVANSVASCCPADNFSYHEGRKWALQRALEKAGLDTPTRANAWHTLLNR